MPWPAYCYQTTAGVLQTFLKKKGVLGDVVLEGFWVKGAVGQTANKRVMQALPGQVHILLPKEIVKHLVRPEGYGPVRRTPSYTATTARSGSIVRTRFSMAPSVPEIELGQLPQAPW